MVAKLKNLSLSTIVLICFGLGILNGLFFGEMVAWMGVIGNVFIKLLQMTIIPYIVVSLITSLGKMSYEQAKLLGVKVGKLMVIFWIAGLLAIYTIKFIFPQWEAGSFFSTSLLQSPKEVNLIDLYIPSNPFFSLSNSYVPAIVIFCIATGIALIGIKEKKSLMEQMDSLSKAFNVVNGYIVKLMPLGIFAMTSATAGTMEIDEFEKLQVYFAGHILMTFLLAYWVLPIIIITITPFKYKDVVGIAKDALITAFAAGNIFIVIPILIERTKELFKKYNLADEKTDSYADIIIPVVFSFPNLGKLLTIIFVLFAAWFSGSDVSFFEYLPMSINGLISLFGSVYLTVPMLLDSLKLPTDLFQLYMVSSLLTSRFTSLLAAMNIFLLAVGGTAMLAGIAKVNKKRLIMYSILTPFVFLITCGGSYILLSKFISSEYTMDRVIMNMRVADKTPHIAKDENSYKNFNPTNKPRTIQDIKKSGVLVVGYNPSQVPFSYYNIENKLVGFDIELVRTLAKELGVKIKFFPYKLNSAVKLLKRGKIDFAISGLQVTTKRMLIVDFTKPILNLHYALVVKDYRKEDFSNDEYLKKTKLTIATVGDYDIIPKLKEKFPNIKFVKISSDKRFFGNDKYDALLISLEAGKAWTLLKPAYTTVFRKEEIKSFPASYAVAKGNTSLLNFLDNWLNLQRSSGKIKKLYDYWIQGINAKPKEPRWSVIKDVLHLVDE
jgi:Na+/H+-dicarboxylate symporter